MPPGKGQGKGETTKGKTGGGDEFSMAAVAGAGDAAAQGAPLGPSDGGFGKMSQEVQYQLMEAAGLKPGPNVSLALAVDKFRREKMREVFLYMLFLFLFTTSTYLQRDVAPAHMYLQEVKRSILLEPFPNLAYQKTFHDIRTDVDFWDYISNVIPNYLFEGNGTEINYILKVNRIVQAPRLRQVRVKRETGNETICRVVPRLQVSSGVQECYPPFSAETKGTDPLTGWPPGTRMKYRSGEELKTEWYGTGILSYEGGGYAFDFPLNTTRSDTREIIAHLKAVRWTDAGTRAVFFDFCMFNPMERFFLSCRLLFEFLPYGRVNPVSSFRVMRIGLDASRDYAVFGLDGCVYVMILYYMYKDLKMIQFLGWARFWAIKWHWLNLLIYAIFSVALFFKFRFWVASLGWAAGDSSRDDFEATFDFEALGWTYNQIWNWTAFNSIFVWLKAFGYFKYIGDRMSILSSTVILASSDIMIFLVFFGLLVYSYSVAMYTSFGTDVAGHKRVIDSWFQHCFFLMRKIEGQFDPVTAQNRILGPILLISFGVFCVFGLSRITLSILNKYYANMLDHGEDDAMTIEFRISVYRTLGRIRHRMLDILLWRKRDDVAMFRQERDIEMEAMEDRASKPKKGKKEEGIDPKIITGLNKNLKIMTTHTGLLQDKIKKLYRRYARLGLVPEDDEEEEEEVDADLVRSFDEVEQLPEVETEVVPGNKGVLPPTWRMMEEDDGRIFYFNVETRKVQWDAPLIKTAVVPAQKQARSEDDEEEPQGEDRL